MCMTQAVFSANVEAGKAREIQAWGLWRYIYDKIKFTEMAIQLVESDIQQVKFDKKKATKGEKH